VPPPDPGLDLNSRFRERREQARRRRKRQRSIALAVAIVAAALVALGATVIGTRVSDDGTPSSAKSTTTTEDQKPKAIQRTPLPAEIRGVHVTMALASIPGRLDHYLSIPGLTAI
jgi:hypothetical protein